VPPQATKDEAVKALQWELRHLTLNYLVWTINPVAIRVIKPDASVGKGGRSFIQASKVWVIVSPKTKTNCAFSACELSINRDKYKWLLEKGEKRLVQRSADVKHRLNQLCPFCNNFRLFFHFHKYPSSSVISGAFSRENRFPPKRPKIAKHTKHESLPKRDAISLKFP